MKITAYILSLALVLHGATSAGTGEIAALIRKDVPAGWSLKRDGDRIVIAGPKVWIKHPFTNVTGRPGETKADYYRRIGFETDFLIELKVTDRLSDDDIARIRDAKRAFLERKIADAERRRGEKIDQKMRGYLIRRANDAFPLPLWHDDSQSIWYGSTDEQGFMETYPASAKELSRLIMSRLSESFTAHETGS